MIGVVVSEPDVASVHIGERLLDIAPFVTKSDGDRRAANGGGTYHVLGPEEIAASTGVEPGDAGPTGLEVRRFETRHLDSTRIADAFGYPALLVFASRHAGETGPLLTAHFTGNFGPAEFGGRDRSLARAAPLAHDRLLERFAVNAPDGYEVGMECTHHGPTEVGCPSLFAEVGSAEPQWADPTAATAVARSLLELAAVWHSTAAARAPAVAGFGGGHYAHRFDRVRRETGWCLGHVAADWGLDDMGDPAERADVLGQVFDASGTDLALVDGDRPSLVAAIEELGYRVVSETWLRATDGVPGDLVEAVEEQLGSVEEGVRFGDQARRWTGGDLHVGPLPDELLGGARAVDPESTWAAVEAAVVAFETVEGASRAAGRAVVDDPAAFDSLVSTLLAILEERYETVEVRADAVVASEASFDPAAARELGVPEGPAFGRLADGEPVEIADRTIDPHQVRTERERRFTLPDW